MVWIVSIISGALIAAMVYLLLRSVQSNHLTVNQRMQSIVDGTLAGIQQNADDEDNKQTPLDRFMKRVRELSKSIRDFHGSKVLDLKMQQAGLPLLGSEFIVIDVMAAVLGCVIAFLLTMSLSMAFIGGIAGFAVPWVYLSMKINRRQKLFTDQLQDTLSMVAMPCVWASASCRRWISFPARCQTLWARSLNASLRIYAWDRRRRRRLSACLSV